MNSGPSIPFISPVVADGLGDGQDVRLGERVIERRSAMAAGAEEHALPGVGGVGPIGVIGTLERRDVDQSALGGGLTRQRMIGHHEALLSFDVTWLGPPDLARVLGDRPVARELARMGHVQDGPARPCRLLKVNGADLDPASSSMQPGRQGACNGRRVARACPRSGPKIPGSFGLKALEAIMSSARRVSGSCS